MASIISGTRRNPAPLPDDDPAVASTAGAACACPALGLDQDPDSFGLVPATSHRCYVAMLQHPVDEAGEGPAGARVPLSHQQDFCLTAQHARCQAWLSGAPLPGPGAPGSPGSGVPAGALAQLRGLLPGAPPAALLLRVALAGSLVVALSAGALWLRGERSGAAAPAAVAVQPATFAPVLPPAAPAAAAAVQPAAQPVAPRSLSLFGDAAKAIQAALSAPAATSAPAPHSYTVQPGDGLSLVAQKFGVSLTALAQANGLSPSQGLNLGQLLIIPAPGQ